VPRGGNGNDNAHPPIYPTKLASAANYNTWRGNKPDLIKVYEFVCRHFLACCSLPAIAFKTQAGLCSMPATSSPTLQTLISLDQ